MRTLAAALAGLLLAGPLCADVVVLVNGDRITGNVVGKVTRRLRLQTPYGLLVIPADKVDRIKHSDGSEEVLNAAPAPAATPTPPPAPATLLLIVSGASFWQAWDPKAAPADPSLRLEVRLDDRIVATYTDVNLDPEDLPKAIVNSFVFSPERLFVSAGQEIHVAPPSLAASEIRLKLGFPPALAGEHALHLAYQVNEAGSAAPRWRDVVQAAATVVLVPGRTSAARLLQDRGTMEYTRRLMRGEFHVTIEAEPAP